MGEKRSLEILAITLASIGMIVTGTLVFSDTLLARLLFANQSIHSASIGTVAKSESDVRRRIVQNLTWLPLSERALVFEGDNIFTGHQSEAEVVLDGGSKLLIGANSLVVLSIKSGQTNLDVQYGSVIGQLVGEQKIKLKLNGQDTEVSGQNSKIQIRANKGKAEVAVLDGKVSVSRGSEKKDLTKSEKVQVTDTTTTVAKVEEKPLEKTEEAGFRLLEPRAASRLWLREKEPVRFSWSPKTPDTKYEIQFSRDESFSTILARHSTDAPMWESTDAQKLGAVYWRVKSARNGLSEVFALSVYPDTAPVTVAPDNGQALTLQKSDEGVPSQSLELIWKDESGASKFRVQMGLSPQLSEPTQLFEASGDRFMTAPLPAGTYYWRVQAQDPDRKTPSWSQVSSFKLENPQIDKPVLAGPALLTRQLDVELEAKFDQKRWLQLGDDEQKELLKNSITTRPVLRWGAVEGASGYEVEVARAGDEAFARPQKFQSKTNSVAIEPPGVGPFIWRVKAISAAGAAEPSSTGKMNFTVAPPASQTPKALVDRVPDDSKMNLPLKEIELKWKPVPFADGYEVELAKTETFENAERFQTKDINFKTKPKQMGANFWRVRPLNARNQALGRFSSTQTLTYTRVVELEPPPILKPLNDSSLIFVGAGASTVLFEWRKVDGAAEYLIEVSETTEFANPVFSQRTPNRKALMDSIAKPGGYFWRLKAVNDQRESPWTAPQKFWLEQNDVRQPAGRN